MANVSALRGVEIAGVAIAASDDLCFPGRVIAVGKICHVRPISVLFVQESLGIRAIAARISDFCCLEITLLKWVGPVRGPFSSMSHFTL